MLKNPGEVRTITTSFKDGPGAAFLVRVKRRPDQAFVTRDREIVNDFLATCKLIGWTAEVETFRFQRFSDVDQQEKRRGVLHEKLLDLLEAALEEMYVPHMEMCSACSEGDEECSFAETYHAMIATLKEAGREYPS